MLEGEDTDAEDEAEVHRDLDEDLHDEVAATGAEQEATQAADQDMAPADAGAACMNGCIFVRWMASFCEGMFLEAALRSV